MRRFKNTKKIRGTHPRRNNNLNNAGVRSRVFHEAVEIQDPFQDDLWLISLKPQTRYAQTGGDSVAQFRHDHLRNSSKRFQQLHERPYFQLFSLCELRVPVVNFFSYKGDTNK